jgi:endonuclease/exonuclease/phosphatase (EEP) superfamily protein YafD
MGVRTPLGLTRLALPAPAWPALVPWTLTGLLAVTALVRLLRLDRSVLLIQVIAFTPYVALGALLTVAIAVVCRRYWAAGLAGLVAVALIAGVTPRAFGTPSTAAGTPLTVMSVNLWLGTADAPSIVELVRDQRVDVLAVQELTPSAAANLDRAGLSTLLPYREAHPAPRSFGSGLYARYPLTGAGARIASPGGYRQAFGVVEVPGTAPVRLESVHPVPPIDPEDADRWAAGLRAQLPAGGSGPRRILAGDFNATLDHGALRDLLGTGYRDAADEVGAGLTPTWPFAGLRSLITPRITLDHVLVPAGVSVRAYRAVTIPHTDHRAIVAALTLA